MSKIRLLVFIASPSSFQEYKTDMISQTPIRRASAMSAVTLQLEGAGSETTAAGPTLKAPELDVCNHYVGAVSPVFDPKRVLLSRKFFINECYSKYVSVGFYPALDYQPLVEFGAVRKRPLLLKDQHVRAFAKHLPTPCVAMCGNEHYSCVDGAFRLHTTGSYRIARLALDKQYIS
jgi:hypothetical protein